MTSRRGRNVGAVNQSSRQRSSLQPVVAAQRRPRRGRDRAVHARRDLRRRRHAHRQHRLVPAHRRAARSARLILCFLAAGLVERIGFYFRGRAAAAPGRLPERCPTVCVQLPMFNEHAVARRVIEAACAMRWPADRLSVQVLDDSTDDDTRRLVDRACADMRAATGVDCRVLRREDRQGYKAGALEAGRRLTGAEFIVIFDADFLPPGGLPRAGASRTSTARRRAGRGARARPGAVGPPEPRRVGADARAVAVGRRPPHAADVVALGAVAVRQLHRHGRRVARVRRRGGRRLARGEPRRGLRAELPPPVRRLPDEVRQGDRRARRAARDVHRLQGAAEALDPGLGPAPAAAPADAADRLPLLAGPAPRLRLPHVHLLAVAALGAVADDAAAADLHRPVVRRARHRERASRSTSCPRSSGC